MNRCGCGRCDDQTTIGRAREGRDRPFDLPGVAHVDCVHLDTERQRHGLYCAELADTCGTGGIPKNRRSLHVWLDLLEQFQPFPAQTVFEIHEAGYVAAW